MSNARIYFLMVLSCLFWGGAFIATKLSTPYIPTFTLTFYRFFIAAVILYFVLLKKDKNIYRLTKKDIPVFLITGIIGMFGYHVLFFTSLRYTTAINSSLLSASSPIITTILCIIFLKDKVNPKRLAGIAISFSGVMLTISNANLQVFTHLSFNHGDLIMLAAVIVWSSYQVYSKTIIKNYSPILLIFYSFVFCDIFLIPFVIYENPLTFINKIPLSAHLSVIYMGIFPSVVSYVVQQYSILKIGPSRTSIFINLIPIFSITLSVLILGETFTPVKLLTALLIIAGVYICQKS
ncbi:MAG: DMT family transporter [Solirubrobacterales bacterium]